MALSVFDNMRAADPKPHFVVGITEDVGNRSLPTAELDVSALLPKGTQEAMFWGLGSDGTVGANHTAIELLVKEGKQFGQGYFSYSAHKSGGLTCSHLRFGPEQFQAPYMLQAADYVGCHFTGYIQKYGARLIQDIKEGGSFVINSPWKSAEETAANLPAAMKRLIAERDIKLYTIDANAIAADCGIAGRINMIMQAVFFSLSTVMPAEESLGLLRKECEHMFGKMGSAMVEMNQAALDQAVDNVIVLDYDKAAWAAAKDSEDPAQLKRVEAEKTEFVETVVEPMADLRGDELPVSAFSGAAIGGKLPPGVTKYEKRAIADAIPVWDPEECTQCNKCATACPHAVIRPFLLSKSAGEVAAKPEGFLTLPAKPFGLAKKATKDFEFSMQVSAFDCTGCTVCAKICPEDGALTMTSFHPEDDKAKATVENWAYAMSLPSREDLFLPGKNKMAKTLKAQQFKTPLLEFSGACQGCAETPIVKLVTQMYGSQMLVANATGCSSIWAGSYPMNPYTVNSEGHGPAWGNSLFEDNAEYGFGMHVASTSRRESLLRKVEAALEVGEASGELATALQGWVAAFDDLNASKAAATEVKAALAGADSPFAAELAKDADMLAKKSQWIFGGDGWAYDIGFGGLDHVLASGEDVNVVVFDTEVYSNTGGQCSKSTPRGGVAKFSTHGKPTAKKDLGRIAMTYGNVYVASVSMGADESHLVKVMQEAAEYPGPSLVLSYSPCIAHGVKGGLKNQIPEQRLAVESGYWNLYRYDPRRAEAGENPFQLDYDPDTSLVEGFMDKEARFTSLRKDAPEVAEERLGGLAEDVRRRADVYRELAKEE
jgi:pyruvate-ferredoxin/flavodoxin oxidoreductase